jgi:hypothetical protein
VPVKFRVEGYMSARLHLGPVSDTISHGTIAKQRFTLSRHGCNSVGHQAVRNGDCRVGTAGTSPAPTEARPSRAGVPTMETLSGSNVLIVGEAPGIPELRERLITKGANVQVVSVAGAAIVIRQKQIDSAFIAASLDVDTHRLCEELVALEIPRIFVSPDGTAPLGRALASGAALNSLRRKLRIPAYS